MGLVPSLILMLAKLLFIIGFALAAQASRGITTSPSPAFFPVIPHREVTQGPSPIQHGESWGSSAPTSPSYSDSDATLPLHPSRKSWRTIAPTTPAVPNGPLLHPSVTLPPPASTPLPEKITGSEPSASPRPSTIILSPPPSYMVVPAPSASEGQVPPSLQQSPAESRALTPVSTPDAPAPIAIPSTNMPKKSPVSQPTEHDLPPNIGQRNAKRGHNLEPFSPGQVPPSVQQSPPENKAPTPVSTPDAPGPIIIPSANMPKKSPVGQPSEHDLPPNDDQSNANRSHNLEPVSPAPIAMHSVNLPKNLPRSPPTEDGSLPPIVHKGDSNKSHSQVPPALVVPSTKFPNNSPISQPTGYGSLPPHFHTRNSSTDHTLEPVSPSSLAIPPITSPKISPARQPTIHGNLPCNVHKRTTNKGHTPEPVPPAPVTSPTSAFPVNPPSVHPVIPAISPSELRAPVVSPASMPSRIFNWKKGGAPVAAPLYQKPKPLSAVTHSPPQAPAAHKAFKHFHQAPQPLISSPKSPFNKGFHSPVSSPSTSFSKHHHKRNIATSPAPASSYLVSPHTSINQGQAMPPSLLPRSGQRHYAPPPVNPATPLSFPALPPASQVSHAPSPSFEFGPRPTKIPFLPPKVSPSESSSKRPKTPVLPQVQSLPPPPPNEDCLSIVCTEPYTNSPPGAPCRCVWPMQVGLRLGVSLYTFFPLVSELASEIASGVFMKQSQVRIMGAKSSNQQAEKTDVLIDLVPLGENFDNTTAFLTSERFWHKKVVIKAADFGDYEVLYVSYPGLPPSPPLPPSSITMIDGGPYSNDGNNGRTIKPLGVDIPKRQHKSGISSGVIAIISISAFVAVVLCSAAAWVLFKRRDHVSQTASPPRVLPPSLPKTPGTAGSLTGRGQGSGSSSFRSSIAAYKGSAKTFSMNDIERATDNFHDSRIIGEGGFGRVYSGTLEDGIKVAVKVLKRGDHHGDREFLAEVEMLSRLHHRNLVKLIGICAEDNFRCLVYELIPNGSVESHLHGVHRETNPIDWDARMKIALGAARGLAYLHEDSSPRVIHRDFKSSNILLEDDFTPKVSDFGLARIATDEDNRHISTRVMGTFGYVAPEYAMTGHLLVKSDVYSYGVVLLELLTGRKPVDMSQPPGQENLVAWARPLLTSKEGLEAIIDRSLGSDVPFDSVAKVAAIASMCVQPEVSNRPFMGEVVQALKLVCNECDEAKEACSRSSSKEDLSIDLDMGVSTVSGQLPDNFQGHQLTTNFDSEVDIERGLSASELFISSTRFGRQATSGSFRRHSYSGPLRTGRNIRLWQIMRRLSGGSVSEHGIMFKL